MESTNYATACWGTSWEEASQQEGSVATQGIQGVANLVGNKVILHVPFGELLPSTISYAPDEPLPKVEYLYGITGNNDHIVLTNPFLSFSQTSSRNISEQFIEGSYLLSGKERFDPSRAVEQAYIGITGLKEWVEEVPIVEKSIPGISMGCSVEFGKENCERTLFSDDQFEIKVIHDFEPSHLSTSGVSIKHDCRLTVVFKAKTYFNEAFSIIKNQTDFITLCRDFYSSVESLELMFADCSSIVKCFGRFPSGSTPEPHRYYPMPFAYPAIKNDLQKLLKNWIYLSDDLRQAVAIFTSLLSNEWNMPFDLQFFALSQVLELLSKCQDNLRVLPREEYRKRKQAVLSRIEDQDLREWLEVRFPGNQKKPT